MGREVPFNSDQRCDDCGVLGAYDFMGDYICQTCADKALDDEVDSEPKP